MVSNFWKVNGKIRERRIELSKRLFSLSNHSENIHDSYALNVKIGGPEHGPAIVFLHGGGGESNNFKHQLSHFARLGYLVIAIDGNGSGKSDYRKLSVWGKRIGVTPKPYEEHAHDVHAVLEELGVRTAVFIGHSDGAQIIQTYTSRYPDSVKAQVLVGGQTHYALIDRFYNALISIITPNADQYPRSVLWAVSKLFFNSEKVRRTFLKENRVPSPKAMRNWVLSFDRFRTPKHPPKVPTLVMYGEMDSLTKGEQAPLAEIWKARVVTIRGAGHLPFAEMPKVFNQKLKKFLDIIGWKPR